MYNIGEKPGEGRYCCNRCSWSVYLDDDDDRLPPGGKCPKGEKITYVKC